mmetsp:Transcript_16695/g.40937  ORF Transcript_16695/g.40937 Transcript_16695/m.40937 type:complete len:323 (+) Transcript_16695:224-1192(+)
MLCLAVSRVETPRPACEQQEEAERNCRIAPDPLHSARELVLGRAESTYARATVTGESHCGEVGVCGRPYGDGDGDVSTRPSVGAIALGAALVSFVIAHRLINPPPGHRRVLVCALRLKNAVERVLARGFIHLDKVRGAQELAPRVPELSLIMSKTSVMYAAKVARRVEGPQHVPDRHTYHVRRVRPRGVNTCRCGGQYGAPTVALVIQGWVRQHAQGPAAVVEHREVRYGALDHQGGRRHAHPPGSVLIGFAARRPRVHSSVVLAHLVAARVRHPFIYSEGKENKHEDKKAEGEQRATATRVPRALSTFHAGADIPGDPAGT